ncbi:MAG TPA: transglycosylase SLT domain-containing protein [Gemmatimonadaceae bacterium]|nr:transglycosylase SLT domain-containing protein [Gemmatimonadaceae bacterium]
MLLPFMALLVSTSACTSSKDAQRDTVGVLSGDTTKHVLPLDDRELVARARELDRADSRDSARVAYEEAAKRLPQISDWLYLRAAGVTADSSARDAYYRRVRTAVARDRIRWTEAQARERTGDIPGAIRMFTAVGGNLQALRLRAAVAADDPAASALAKRDLLAFIARSNTSSETRDAIDLFGKVFTTTTPAEELILARAAANSGVPERAAAGFARAFQAGLGSTADRFSYATMLFRLRKFPEAGAEFAKVRSPSSLAASAQYQRARALVAVGNITAGRTVLRTITTTYPRDTSAASALLLLADLATDDNRDADARQTLLGLLTRFPSGRHAANARFRAGMIAYIQGNRRAAAAEFDSLVARDPNSAEALGAAYWAGRSFAALGDTTRSRARWRSVIAKEPLSYYAVMAAKRLDTTLVARDRTVTAYPKVPAVDSAVARVTSLRDAGMNVEADFELDRLFRDAGESRDALLATAAALAGTDQATRSTALGRRALDEIGPTAANYRLFYPVVERETLVAAAKENGLDPVFVASLIRQESNWNPRATSPVGARGLMQLMPPVGEGLARTKGIRPWDPEMLYDPAISITLGTLHLRDLVRKYPKDPVKVLAAYNAGESRVEKWSTKAGANDPEVFTERIPFVETRDYVRIVLRNQAYYDALYPW